MTPRPAATVMVVRDGRRGIETFMLKRRRELAFVPGAHVFPGGALDSADGYTDVAARCHGLADTDASRRLGLQSGGLAYWVAAIREAFEEVGVLFAYDHTGSTVRLDHDGRSARFGDYRQQVDGGRTRLAEVCRREGIRLAPDAIRYFGRWITPPGLPRRYDTRFFVAAAPDGQTLVHEEGESLSGQWVRPGDALARSDTGAWELILPTHRSLQLIGRFERVDELLTALDRAQGAGPDRSASVVEDSGGWRVDLPDAPAPDPTALDRVAR